MRRPAVPHHRHVRGLQRSAVRARCAHRRRDRSAPASRVAAAAQRFPERHVPQFPVHPDDALAAHRPAGGRGRAVPDEAARRRAIAPLLEPVGHRAADDAHASAAHEPGLRHRHAGLRGGRDHEERLRAVERAPDQDRGRAGAVRAAGRSAAGSARLERRSRARCAARRAARRHQGRAREAGR